jgi:hypothetical protein
MFATEPISDAFNLRHSRTVLNISIELIAVGAITL